MANRIARNASRKAAMAERRARQDARTVGFTPAPSKRTQSMSLFDLNNDSLESDVAVICAIVGLLILFAGIVITLL